MKFYLSDNGIICYDEFDDILKNKLEVLDESVEDCVRNAFDLLDYDKNGYITIPELFHLFGEVGEMWTDQDLYEVVKAGDIDGDGRLDLEGSHSLSLFLPSHAAVTLRESHGILSFNIRIILALEKNSHTQISASEIQYVKALKLK